METEQRSRYNLRRRKDGDPKQVEEVKKEDEGSTTSPATSVKTEELEFGGRIGKIMCTQAFIKKRNGAF